MRLLELFSGTGSVGEVFRAEGWEVISLDINPKSGATIIADILTWDYRKVPDVGDFRGQSLVPDVGDQVDGQLVRNVADQVFDCIWASPCCTMYSCARRGARTPRDLEGADALVLKTLEIIDYFKPRCWFIENPQTGLLKTRPFMKDLPFTDLDYCRYSDVGFRKRTRIWNNVGLKGLLCEGVGKCENMIGKRHRSSAQQGKNRLSNGELYGLQHRQQDLFKIPERLCLEICMAAMERI